MRRIIVLFIILIFTALSLAACGSRDAPAEAIQAYLEALVEKDADRVVNLSCADWETDATVEVDSLESVEAALEDVSCQSDGVEGDYTLVSCSGRIVLTYEGEDRPLELDTRAFQTLQEGSEWLMCGYH